MRRGKFEICADILRISVGGASPSKLRTKGGLTYGMYKYYTQKLIANKCLKMKKVNGVVIYSTTKRGEQTMKEVDGFIEDFRLGEKAE